MLLVFGQWIIDSWVGGSALPIFGHCLIKEFGQRSTLPWLKQRNLLLSFVSFTSLPCSLCYNTLDGNL